MPEKKKKLNKYFEKMLEAKSKEKQSFQYKGELYKRTTIKNGLVTYKKHVKKDKPKKKDTKKSKKKN
mgnify:CR=1 FL=1